jgi:hypothetical protein
MGERTRAATGQDDPQGAAGQAPRRRLQCVAVDEPSDNGFLRCAGSATLAGLLIYGYGAPIGLGVFGPVGTASYVTWKLATNCDDPAHNCCPVS